MFRAFDHVVVFRALVESCSVKSEFNFSEQMLSVVQSKCSVRLTVA